MGFKGGGVVVSLAERRARRNDRATFRAEAQERLAASHLYPVPRERVSDVVPIAWRGVAPVLLAEFQVDDDFDGAA